MGGKVRRTLARGAYAALAGLAAALAAAPASHAEVRSAVPSGPLTLAGAVRPVKAPGDVYLVKLKQPGAATYKGGAAGFAATKPAAGRRLDSRTSVVESYVRHLESTHDRLLAEVGAASAKIYSYRYAMNGFAARLRSDQVARLAQSDEVERIWPDTDQRLDTNNSAVFLGLEDRTGGLRAALGLRGENIVIGVIDSGIAPGHPSLSDVEKHVPKLCESHWAAASWLGAWLCGAIRKDPPSTAEFAPIESFHGTCEEGDGFPASACNNKVVGARYYIDGFLARHELDPNEFMSPKDADGHGTHIATTAAGNPTTATLFGRRIARVAGIAPRARIAVYKACWLTPGSTRATCATSDLARAIDDAVADGVDIINYSVGSLETDLTAPDDMALLNAFDAGVLTVVAAGNDGPTANTIGSPSSDPWVLTTAASTESGTRYEEAIEITAPKDLAGRIAMREASFTPPLDDARAVEGKLVLVDDGVDTLPDGGLGSARDACEPAANAEDLDGAVALIARGGCEFQTKLANVQQAGAIAAVVFNDAGSPIVMNGDRGSVKIPAVMIGTADGQRLVDRLADDEEITLHLLRGVFLERRESGYQLGDFSSRGPNLSEPDFVKPDVTAPGIDILAGNTPDAANGVRGEWFQYLSGTSMAAPETVGTAALLKEAHPDWSPAMLKSALMTSAYAKVYGSDGETLAGPFDTGAGHIDPDLAVDPGLVYDSGFLDHAAFLCGLEYAPFTPTDCNVLAAAGYSFSPSELNLPSIGVSRLVTGDVITRRVTNVGPPATYTVSVQAPAGIGMDVSPTSLSLGTGESGDFAVTFTDAGAPLDTWSFGRLVWSDGRHNVASPIAVNPVTLRAPEEIKLTGAAGSFPIPVAFGYTGAYFAGVHGLRAAYTEDGFVDEDTTNSFSFRFDNGVTAHLIEVPPNQLFARFALFDDATDGADDLDLYLFYCPNNQCTQVAQSGGFTSNERIDLESPKAGVYAVLVHGFETDPSNGEGANYRLYAWSVGFDDVVGNLSVAAPQSVVDGDRTDLDLEWSGLKAATRYLGVISHNTPSGIYALSVVDIDSP
ncbi:MAG TPA: S8 family serine peptidase [Gammaproteobacteria bacterium]|nr:S8 family serine peptidase [Gammaproteobacteria bacterium]